MVRFFFTFHRCASKFMGQFCDVDYAWLIYKGDMRPNRVYRFDEGVMYGPIRISEDLDSPIRHLNRRVYEFTPKIGVFMTRNQEDVMRSEYKTFRGFHGLSPVEEIAEIQDWKMGRILKMTEDEYLEYRRPKLQAEIDEMYDVASNCEESIFVTYEEMVNNFDSFKDKIQPYFNKHIENGQPTW